MKNRKSGFVLTVEFILLFTIFFILLPFIVLIFNSCSGGDGSDHHDHAHTHPHAYSEHHHHDHTFTLGSHPHGGNATSHIPANRQGVLIHHHDFDPPAAAAASSPAAGSMETQFLKASEE